MFLRAVVSQHRKRKSSSNKMAAGLNGGQRNKMAVTNHNTEHTHINLAVLIRHSLRYKTTVSQKPFYRDTKLQRSSKISKGGGPETMPAYTNTESRRQTHRQTNIGL